MFHKELWQYGQRRTGAARIAQPNARLPFPAVFQRGHAFGFLKDFDEIPGILEAAALGNGFHGTVAEPQHGFSMGDASGGQVVRQGGAECLAVFP